jgi:PncC family amidohydrolase
MSLAGAARRVAQWLARRDQKVVFAESCTGGLVSGTLTRIPGISKYHCGGMVVYRDATKEAYLGIPRRLLARCGAVSPEVAARMAENVLRRTPEAHVALSVTGHLGPDAPRELDGKVFLGLACLAARRGGKPQVAVTPLDARHLPTRLARQRWVVEQSLLLLEKHLATRGD